MKSTVTNEVQVEIAELLKEILADQFVLYTKARNFHWNVTGVHFFYLHNVFETIYNVLSTDIDEIAERIRALGEKAPGTLKEFLTISSLTEDAERTPDSSMMAEIIVKDFERVFGKINNTAKEIQKRYEDEVTASMLYDLVQKYQKHAWMLRAYLK